MARQDGPQAKYVHVVTCCYKTRQIPVWGTVTAVSWKAEE